MRHINKLPAMVTPGVVCSQRWIVYYAEFSTRSLQMAYFIADAVKWSIHLFKKLFILFSICKMHNRINHENCSIRLRRLHHPSLAAKSSSRPRCRSTIARCVIFRERKINKYLLCVPRTNKILVNDGMMWKFTRELNLMLKRECSDFHSKSSILSIRQLDLIYQPQVIRCSKIV